MATSPGPDLAHRLHTMLVTDGRADPDRLVEIVTAAVRGGMSAVQVREPDMSAREIERLCMRLQPICRGAGALLLLNDCVEVAASGWADGVHLPGHAPPPEVVPVSVGLRGRSVHDAAELDAAGAADYVVLAPLFPTSCKPGAAHLGTDRAEALVARAPMPVVLLGGIDPDNAVTARRVGAAGIAVRSAVCEAADPEAVARSLVATA